MRWAYVMESNNKNKTSLTDNGCHFLNSEITEVETKTNEQEMASRDGVLAGSNTFGSFELSLNFHYDGGIDSKDLMLFTEKIKKLIHVRDIMYVVHSDMPGRKYSFNSAKVEWEILTTGDLNFTITFNCFKGYSESLLDTSEFSLDKADKWQFEGGRLTDSNIKYKHTSTTFKIYNGSTDIINPSLGYELLIKINIEAPNGFKIINHTTGDIFEYKNPIKKGTRLTIDGVHPIVNNKRVGIDTNWEWINLDKGYNDIEITGSGLGSLTIEFAFNFVYR